MTHHLEQEHERSTSLSCAYAPAVLVNRARDDSPSRSAAQAVAVVAAPLAEAGASAVRSAAPRFASTAGAPTMRGMTRVHTVDAGRRRISRCVDVEADPAEVFTLITDPRRHEELDGSGTVRAPASGPFRLGPGSRFTVNMRQFGIPYRITNTVVAFEPDRIIEWQHPLRHTWRWELTPQPSGVTTVTETFDYSASPAARMYELSGRTTRNAEGITRTLLALQRRFPQR